MLKKILILVALLLGFTARAGEPFFCVTPNRTLYYERYKAGTKTLVQSTTMEIGTVESDGAGRKAHYGLTLRKANGRAMYGGRAEQVSVIRANGDIEVDFAASVTSILKNYFPNAKYTSGGDIAVLPADIKPGDTMPDVHCVVTIAGISVHVDVTDRQVLRRETITTPAGTYDCLVVRAHKVEDAPIHHKDSWSDTWYAPGLGYVRHDSYDKKLNLETSEVLLSVTPAK